MVYFCNILSFNHWPQALIKWFKDNYLKLNADKCHLLISNHNRNITINVGEEIIECESSVKLLGVTLDNKLNFHDHVSNICKKSQPKATCISKNIKCLRINYALL